MYFNIHTKLKDDTKVEIRAYSAALSASSGGLGCQAAIISSAGHIAVCGVKVGETLIGHITAASTAMLTSVQLQKAAALLGGWGEFRNMVWEGIVKNLAGGITLFSDRINRGTPSSNAKSGAMFGDVPMNTGRFGAWLETRPDLGTCIPSPLFNNPNHRGSTDFGLMKVWMFFPSNRPDRIVVDEKKGLAPLYEFWKKMYPEIKEPEKSVYPTYD